MPKRSDCTHVYKSQNDGWRAFKIEKAVGEPGMPDGLFLRYGIEFKRPRGRVSDAQNAWHIRETHLGALTVIVGVDCEAWSDGFRAWFRKG